MLAKERGRWAVSQKRLMIQKPSATQAKTHSHIFTLKLSRTQKGAYSPVFRKTQPRTTKLFKV